MLAGCYPLEALLQSTLRCLYNQTCIYRITLTNTYKALNIFDLAASRFDLHMTIESIVNQLMVEEYANSMSYESYFDQCAPSSCSYSYVDRTNLFDGITSLIALYGGLVIVCRLLTKVVIFVLRDKIRRIMPMTQ